MAHNGGMGTNDAASIDAQRQANLASADARRARSELEALTRRMDRLALMTESLWQLLRERFDLSEAELSAIAHDLDLSDGVLDGRVRRFAVACPNCTRMVGKGQHMCIYCGTEVARAPFADV